MPSEADARSAGVAAKAGAAASDGGGAFEHASAEGGGSERVELILSHIESLPTLSPVAVQVLRLSSDADADIREVTRLIESDPALTARVLKMCKRAERVTTTRITTVERAVVLLGLEAVRSAMLSVEVYGLFAGDHEEAGDDAAGGGGRGSFDRHAFWRHALGVACAAELIAERQGGRLSVPGAGGDGLKATVEVRSDEAFVCGLLHDLGKLALDHVLPRAFGRCVELAERRRCDVGDVSRAVCGLDHHVAGKRLAEHWGLPHALQDVIWLHNQPLMTLPEVGHRGLIALVTVAQRLCRGLHIGWSGNFAALRGFEEVCREQGVDASKLGDIEPVLFERLGERSRALGLDGDDNEQLLLESIAEANRRLGSLNDELKARAAEAERQARVLKAIGAFHAGSPMRRGLSGALGAIAGSVAQFVEGESVVVLWRSRKESPFTRYRFDRFGSVMESGDAGLAPDERAIAELSAGHGLHHRNVETFSWLGEQTLGAIDPRAMGVLRLPMPDGPTAVLLFEDDEGGESGSGLDHACLSGLLATWGAAAAAAAQHEGAKRLGEQLAEANRRLGVAQANLVETRSMARLGELAAGAAHEMNNPLTVLSGNAQLLSSRLLDDELRGRAQSIVEASQRLSDLITSLHLFADPPEPKPSRVNLREMLQASMNEARSRARLEGRAAAPHMRLKMAEDLSDAYLDRRQVGAALTEVITNALESRPRTPVEIRALVSGGDGRLVLQVADDGVGMSEHAMEHACDPFFSEKPAGRQTGLGLARARRLIELNGGELSLKSTVGGGSTVRVLLGEWRTNGPSRSRHAA